MKNKFLQAKKVLNKINLGWNLGNYLDAHDKKFVMGDASSKSVEYVVGLWGNPIFNIKCLDELKKIGVNCLRIPITWCNFASISGENVTISAEAIERIKNIVDYALNLAFVVIIDMHHDDQTWLKVACDNKEFKKVCNMYSKIWDKIAYEFKDYGEDLIFEGMNEIIDRSNCDRFDWIGKKKFYFKRLNKLYKIFIKNVRRYTQNNINRTLMISTYGAQIHDRALTLFKMPKDYNVVVDVHYYSKHNDLDHYKKIFNPLKRRLIDKGVPVILGEIGAKKEYLKDFSIIQTYLTFAKNLNLKSVLWDNGGSRRIVNRSTAELEQDINQFLN